MKIKAASKLARVISTLFVPPSFTLLVFTYFAFLLESEAIVRIVIVGTTFVFGFALHIALFFILMKKGLIRDGDASVKEERTFPFIVAVGFYAIGLVILIIFNVHIIILALWFCYITNTLLIVLINKYWKISAHTMGAAGPLAALVIAAGPVALMFVLLVALIGWARIQLNCHTIGQVIAGGLFGFISTFIQMKYLILLNY